MNNAASCRAARLFREHDQCPLLTFAKQHRREPQQARVSRAGACGRVTRYDPAAAAAVRSALAAAVLEEGAAIHI